MQIAKPVSAPLAARLKLSVDLRPQLEEDKEYIPSVLYGSVVRSIMYAVVFTRPYILHAVRVGRRYMSNPKRNIGKF